MSTTLDDDDTLRTGDVPARIAGWKLDFDDPHQLAYSFGRDIWTAGYGHGYAITRCWLESGFHDVFSVRSIQVRTHVDVDRLRAVDPADYEDLTDLVDPGTVPGDQITRDPFLMGRPFLGESSGAVERQFLSTLDAVFPTSEALDPSRRVGDWTLVHRDGRDFVWKRDDGRGRPSDRLAITSWGLVGYLDGRSRLVSDGGRAGTTRRHRVKRGALKVPYHLEPMVTYSTGGEYTYFESRRVAFEAAEHVLDSDR